MEHPLEPSDDMAEAARLGWLIHDVHRLLGRAFDEEFRAFGLTRAQWRVMIHLLREDGMTQKRLAEIDAIETAPMGRLLDRLEESGWIERRPDPADGRARRVYRTGKITPLLVQLEARARVIFEGALNGLGEGEVGALIAALDRMKDNLRPGMPARPPPRARSAPSRFPAAEGA